MYGYIRPLRSELRVREYELYNAVYCGLCRTLGKHYGLAARFTVSYDLTFLTMLLAEGGGSVCRRRCFAHPMRRRPCMAQDAAMRRAAACCVILYWWKLRDKRRDGSFGERLAAGLAGMLLRRAYRRAAADEADFDRVVRERLGALAALEAAGCAELDAVADCFAQILAAMGEAAQTPEKRRVLRELLYHSGRSIYILDAADDFADDGRTGSYNPLRCRYGDTLTPEVRERVRGTLNLSQRRCAAAFELLPPGRYTEILENILTLGLPEMSTLVLSGQWRQRKKLLRENARRDLEREKI